MSGDELMALLASIVIAFQGWKEWLGGLLFLPVASRRSSTQWLGWLTPLFAALSMLWVLFRWSANDVRKDPTYLAFYFVMWLAWTGLWNRLLPYLGLSCRDDMLERENTAAGLAMGGGLLGVTFIFAGGNIGSGPGWWVVVFCAGLATAVLLLLWLVGTQTTGVDDAITIDRDLAAGWRTAGFFIGAGLILGRAVAGDWHSTRQTLADFMIKGWPVLLLWGTVLGLDKVSRPTPQRPAASPVLFGVLPALLLVAGGVVEVLLQGHW